MQLQVDAKTTGRRQKRNKRTFEGLTKPRGHPKPAIDGHLKPANGKVARDEDADGRLSSLRRHGETMADAVNVPGKAPEPQLLPGTALPFENIAFPSFSASDERSVIAGDAV